MGKVLAETRGADAIARCMSAAVSGEQADEIVLIRRVAVLEVFPLVGAAHSPAMKILEVFWHRSSVVGRLGGPEAPAARTEPYPRRGRVAHAREEDVGG